MLTTDSADETALITSEDFTFTVRHLPIKRFWDIFLSLGLLLTCAPLGALVTLLIKLTSPGPVLYADLRVGRGGTLFRCYKFRTMFADADLRLSDLLSSDAEIQREWQRTRKLRRDPRVTILGYWLRRTSIDELPQLWNVLRGEMSVIGPRPVTSEEMSTLYGVKAAKILSVRPGITGLWQTSGRSCCSYGERIALDEQYVDEQSFLLDAKILVKTVPAVLSLRGAY